MDVNELTEVVSAKRASSKKKRDAKKARAVMRKYGITLGFAFGKRCIYADNAPQDAIDEIKQAMRDDLI